MGLHVGHTKIVVCAFARSKYLASEIFVVERALFNLSKTSSIEQLWPVGPYFPLPRRLEKEQAIAFEIRAAGLENLFPQSNAEFERRTCWAGFISFHPQRFVLTSLQTKKKNNITEISAHQSQDIRRHTYKTLNV